MAFRARTPAERDTQTVEITFAVVSGTFVGGAVFGLFALPLVFVHVARPERGAVMAAATVCALVSAAAWIVRTLRRS